MKSIVTETKNLLEDFLDLSRQKKLKVDQLKSIQSEEEREKRMKKYELRNLWDIMKYSNKCMMAVSEGEEKGRKNN